MPQKIAKPELIISTLRAIEVELSKGIRLDVSVGSLVLHNRPTIAGARNMVD